MFTKVLIANRGEIAVRILATCREMGIRTVAVYSDIDGEARHVREADEAYCLDTISTPQENSSHPTIQNAEQPLTSSVNKTSSYLQIEKILAAARLSGAEAIHPGYGFLSENAAFVEACDQAGITFIGPPAHTIRLMGSKSAAKQTAEAIGAPIVPGYHGEIQEDTILWQEAWRIGFPVLIKAAAGGGGKGMRVVREPETFFAQLSGARREALGAFGDQTMLLERFLHRPRHIEIQILGDAYGNMLYLGERECSIQRRHQKIIEESPSPALTAERRTQMGKNAVQIAKAAGYINAGTVEFILDEDGQFYFLEMNTRLQVEHPVTELTTGLDLVRQQLKIAAGEHLTLSQEDIKPQGHAIEVRIYAEDSQNDFLPATGTVTNFIKPEGPGIRLDSGIENGDEITPYYDPMIAKLIVYGENRSAALARMNRALEQTILFGVQTNLPLLHTVIRHPAFQTGEINTDFLEIHGLLHQEPHRLPVPPDIVLVAAALYDTRQEIDNQQGLAAESPPNIPVMSQWQRLGPWRMHQEYRQITYHSTQLSPADNQSETTQYQVRIKPASKQEGTWHIRINGREIEPVFYSRKNDTQILIRSPYGQGLLYVQSQAEEIHISYAGQLYTLQKQRPPTLNAGQGSGNEQTSQKTLQAPMAGTIISVQVKEGEHVNAHQVLVILGAMKMEHSITAPYDGEIKRVNVQEGSVVKGGSIIIEMG